MNTQEIEPLQAASRPTKALSKQQCAELKLPKQSRSYNQVKELVENAPAPSAFELDVVEKFALYRQLTSVEPTVCQLTALIPETKPYQIRKALKASGLTPPKETPSTRVHWNSEWALYLAGLPFAQGAVLERGRHLMVGGNPQSSLSGDVITLCNFLQCVAFDGVVKTSS